MKNTLFVLVHSALFSTVLAVGAVGQTPNNRLRPVPLSPPGSGQARVPWTELQTLKLENLGLRQNAALGPITAEREALLISMCADAGFVPGSCTYDPPSRTVTGTLKVDPAATPGNSQRNGKHKGKNKAGSQP